MTDVLWSLPGLFEQLPEYDTTTDIYIQNTKPSLWAQSDHPEIVELAQSIVGNETNPYRKAKAIFDWFANQQWEETDETRPDALSFLRYKKANCGGFANLFVALCRAVGIPARNISGFHPPLGHDVFLYGEYQAFYENPPTLGTHVWAEFYLPDYGWVQCDPSWNLFELSQERIITSKGNTIKLGNGFSLDDQNTIDSVKSWFQQPCVPTQTPMKLVVANTATWKTEIGIVNLASSSATGILKGYNSLGTEVWIRNITLPAHGRTEIDVTAAGVQSSNIKSIRFDITSGQAVGYQKFYQSGKYRVGLEASPRSNQESLFVPHIASDSTWWTGIGWNNTTSAAKSLQFTFDTGQQAEKQIGAGGHEAFTIASLFGGTKQPNIGAAQVSNGAGMVGLMLFGGENVLSGVNLSDATTSTLYFPHVAHNNEWWTGIVVYNPGSQTANLYLTYFDAQGGNLGNYPIDVEPGQKLVGDPNSLNFPTGTEWFMVQASLPVTGFELFGTNNQQQLAGYSVVNLAASTGVFPKLERDGWTGIAFVNPGTSTIEIQLMARNDAGEIIAETSMTMTAGQKEVLLAENLFENQDISSATYVSFTANGDVVGFQLNGSADETMLDAIPALGGSHTGGQQLYFPHIAAE